MPSICSLTYIIKYTLDMTNPFTQAWDANNRDITVFKYFKYFLKAFKDMPGKLMNQVIFNYIIKAIMSSCVASGICLLELLAGTIYSWRTDPATVHTVRLIWVYSPAPSFKSPMKNLKFVLYQPHLDHYHVFWQQVKIVYISRVWWGFLFLHLNSGFYLKHC